MSLSRKFVIWIVLFALVVGSLAAYGYYLAERSEEEEKLALLGAVTSNALLGSLDRMMLNGKTREVREILRELEAQEAISGIQLINRDGLVKASTDRSQEGKLLQRSDAGCRECHEQGKEQRGFLLPEQDLFRWAEPIRNKPACFSCHDRGFKNNGILIIDFSIHPFKRHIRDAAWAGISIFSAALVIFIAVFLGLARALVIRKLAVMGDAMRAFQQGDLERRINLAGSDELAVLGAGFNDMAEAVSVRTREKDDLLERLNSSNEALQALIQASPLAIIAFDGQGIVRIWNPAAERIFGWTGAETLGRFNPIVPEDRKGEFWSLLERALSGETLTNVELVRRRKDGVLIDVSVSSAAVSHLAADSGGIMSLIEDITERKKAQEQLRRTYDTQTAINWILNISLKDVPLEGVLKQSLDLILSIPWLSFEARGGIYLTEGEPAQLVMRAQRGLSDLHQENCMTVPYGKCLCGRAAARGEVQFADTIDERHEIRYEGITPHGHYCVPIKSGQTVLGVINIYLKEGHQRDEREVNFLNAFASALAGIIKRKQTESEREKLITDLRTALDSVSRSQKEWRDTFDSITDEIAIIDREFNVIKANRAFAENRGLRPQDAVNRKCYEVVHGSDTAVPNCPHSRTLQENAPFIEEVLEPKTKRVYLVSTFPYRSPASELIGSIHVARDITEQREAETRLMMSERLASLGQMASGIAHEINNPLASIAGCSEGLLTRVRQGQCETKLFETYLNIILEEVFRCKNITTSMLSFVRKTTYEKKDIDINGMLDRTIEIIGFQGRLKELDLRKEYAELPLVHGNEGELRQVFLAIITNALDAMENRGVLTVRTGIGAGRVIVSISDSGPGIPQDALPKIFDPFFTMKADKGGTGLGLSIARKIVVNHAGAIEVTSEPGQGATFTISLPLSL